MRKILQVIVSLSLVLFLFACNNSEKIEPNGKETNNTNTRTDSNQDVTSVKEINNKSTDFSKEAGFSVNKADYLSTVKYENVFLKGNDTAQLDLNLEDNKKAVLLVSKTEELNTSEEKDTSLVADVDVTRVNNDDGIISYSWEKSGFYYTLQVNEALSEPRLEEMIRGFSAFAKEGTL